MSPEARERDFVFSIVITPETFRYLRPFTRSLVAESEVRFRLVANGCPPDEVASMRAFASGHAHRVTLLELPTARMLSHGETLDAIYERCDDGDHFCFVDSDVLAMRRFMPGLLDRLSHTTVVTSCNPAWTNDVVLPRGARNLVGRHATGSDGFVYGSSFLAIYPRAAIEHVRHRWDVTFRGYAHGQLPAPVQKRLSSIGRDFELYDTAKVVNILMQGEGYTLQHADNPALLHIGGISQYLSDPSTRADGVSTVVGRSAPARPVPSFAGAGAGRERWNFAHWAATTLASLVDGEQAPALPTPIHDDARAIAVQRALFELIRRYGDRT
jgi:hypothetical protein